MFSFSAVLLTPYKLVCPTYIADQFDPGACEADSQVTSFGLMMTLLKVCVLLGAQGTVDLRILGIRAQSGVPLNKVLFVRRIVRTISL